MNIGTSKGNVTKANQLPPNTVGSNGNTSTHGSKNIMSTQQNETMSDVDREMARIREEYYAAYDVMTGVRIAATLGGFFGLMVILVVYKSKSKTEKALEDPNVQAAALAEAEEEERQIAAALEQTAYEQLNPGLVGVGASLATTSGSRRSRRSLDMCNNVVTPGWIRNTKRFSSVGGYSSLLEPPTRIHSTNISAPSIIDEDSPPSEHKSYYDDVSTYYNGRNLYVPRRASNVTCSSTGSSYLERRGSSMLQLAAPLRGRRRQSTPVVNITAIPAAEMDCSACDTSIDIRVIQPTPGGSPCGSERHLGDEQENSDVVNDKTNHNHYHRRLAPLASISSCNSSTLEGATVAVVPSCRNGGGQRRGRLQSQDRDSAGNDGCGVGNTENYYYYPDIEMLANDTTDTDTVFREMDCLCPDEDDTDDEVDTFSTDSGEGASCCLEEHQTHRNTQRYAHQQQQQQLLLQQQQQEQQEQQQACCSRDFLAEFTNATRMIDSSSESTCNCPSSVRQQQPPPTVIQPPLPPSGDCPNCSSPLLEDEDQVWTQETLF